MEVIKGRIASVASNAEGLIKPVMPSAPDKTALDAAIRLRNDLEAQNTELSARWNTYIATGKTADADWIARVLQPELVTKLSAQRNLVDALQKEYDSAYSLYEQRIAQYNKDFTIWAEATAKINNTAPEVLKAQIEAEKEKTNLSIKAAESSTSQSNKKWLVIGFVVVLVIVASAFAWYYIKKKRG
jgi:hypothetical protein